MIIDTCSQLADWSNVSTSFQRRCSWTARNCWFVLNIKHVLFL